MWEYKKKSDCSKSNRSGLTVAGEQSREYLPRQTAGPFVLDPVGCRQR